MSAVFDVAPAPRRAGLGRPIRRCLFVGLGGIGQRHLRNLRALRGAAVDVHAFRVRRELQVVTDKLEVAPGEDLETKYGVEAHADLDLALSKQPDVVFVTNPSSLHVDVT
ncbi:MAG TPA: Gfo/Idh/MocA family oxidoreductase, partial [Polyangiaceae bacterium]|nr:Gfo/Idh/MocA family oxidoreductase [Polyangiaceae bacterium]